MNKFKLISDISASAVQVVFNQLSGIIIFLVMSVSLDKASLGIINWLLAMLLVIFAILGFGLEHVTVRKIATGANPRTVLEDYLVHVLISALVFGMVISILYRYIPLLQQNLGILCWLAIAHLLSFMATPFRQIVNGLEKFRSLLLMSSVANAVRLVLLSVFFVSRSISADTIVKVYLAASVVELAFCILIYRLGLRQPLPSGFDLNRYRLLLKETLPLLGVTIFNTAVARMDWVLLGLMSTAVVVADYSITNKLFELATLPLLVLAPVLFPRITRMFEQEPGSEKTSYLGMLIRVEIVIAVFVALIANLCWEDAINFFTGGKYGSTTRPIFLVMSFAMPLLYINNIFWSLLFARQKRAALFFVFLLTFLVNIVFDLLVIPYWGALGAAAGYVLALTSQAVCYYFITAIQKDIKQVFLLVVPAVAAACLAGWGAYQVTDILVWRISIASAGYLALLLLMGFVRSGDWRETKKFVGISPKI